MDIIGGLLRSSLLKELGDDEERVGRVRAAVRDLSAELSGKSRALISYAVIAAIDEVTPAAATPLVAAEHALLGRWETYRNAFPGQPTEILRAVALAAVADAADGDHAVRQAAWYALRTATERLPAGRWQQPVADLAAGWEPAIRDSLAAVWSPPATSNPLRMPVIPRVEDDRIPIETELRDHAKELQAQGHFQHFSTALMGEFAQHVDDLVGVSEELAATAHRRSVERLREFASAFGARLRETLGAHDATMNAVRLRNELLWWRQTAFSARLSRPYAELSAADLAIAAAVDLHAVVPLIAPLAVEHLLAQLVHEAAGTVDVTVAALSAAEQAGVLPAAADAVPAMLIDAVGGGTETPLLPSGQSLIASRAAVLIFRDLQARRLGDTEPPEQPGEAE